MVSHASRYLAAATLSFALLLGFAPAAHVMAQEAGAAQQGGNLTQVRWQKSCSKQEGSDVELCRALTEMRNQQGQVLMRVAVARRTDGGEGYNLLILTPLATLLPSGLAFKIDEGQQQNTQYTTCLRVGCRSNSNAPVEIINEMKAGNQMIVSYVTLSRRQVNMPVSLIGFTAAVEGL